MELGKDFRKIFYVGGAVALVLSLLLIWRTVFYAIPIVGMEAAPHLAISVFFLVVGVGLLAFARRDAKKEAARQGSEKEET